MQLLLTMISLSPPLAMVDAPMLTLLSKEEGGEALANEISVRNAWEVPERPAKGSVLPPISPA